METFWAQATVVDPDPLPLAGFTDSQELLFDELQFPPWQPTGNPSTATLCDPATEEGLADDGWIVKLVHVGAVIPDCVTEKVLPAIVTLSDRDEVDEF